MDNEICMNKIKNIFIIILLLLTSIKANSQLQQSIVKANWVFIIADNVKLPNFDKIDTVKVAVYGKDSPVYTNLVELSKEKTIQGKPVYTEEVTRINKLDYFHIIYLDETKNDFISSIYERIHKTGKLLITYRSEDLDHIMINLLLKSAQEQFQVQSSNLFDENIIAEEKLIAMGGTKLDLQGLYDKKAKAVEEKEKELQEKEKLLIKKEEELNKLRIEVDKQIKLNEIAKKDLEEKTEELRIEKQKAQELFEQVAIQEQVLKNNQFILNNLNKEIYEKQQQIKQQDAEILSKKEELKKQMEELKIQQQKIQEQQATLKVKNVQIRNQRYIIWITTVFILIFLLLSIIIFRSYKIIKKINKELEEKNIKIENQKEELIRQATQLEQYNKELFKLSLVASKTDNSVIITDQDLKIEWVNAGFTRIYGYTHQLLVNEKGDTLFDISASRKTLQELFEQAKIDKKTKTYINQHTTRSGNKIWVQTALTPVLDENDEIQKYIAVESDITKLKEQEFEILQMNEELQLQKAELQAQKEKLEEFNQQIKDSISYAMTIQNSILPLDVEVSKHFTNFIIFKPKDIVSGDFYWWSNTNPNLYFFAVVDCTGHGVPGAFMSLISSRIINEVVEVHQYFEPKEALTQINKRIIKALSQETTNNRDGMDICFVRVERKPDKYQIAYCGAKRPLIYYRRSEKQILQLKGSRRSIGGYVGIHSSIDFEQHNIELNKNDVIYLSSDGMIDQNNPERKRWGSTRFVELLEEIKDTPLFEQKEIIVQKFDEFRQGETQRDDITIWAIKL